MSCLNFIKKEHIHTQLAVRSDIILRSRTWKAKKTAVGKKAILE